jgi:ketosteroid isomerase-like protein
MPQDNLEVLRRLNEAFNRRDVDGAMQYLDPEVELHPGVQVPDEESRYLGRDGLRDWFLSATEPWEMILVEHRELIDRPGDRVLAVERWTFRGRDGIELELELPNVYTFRDGLIVRIDGFTDRVEALEAVGLREER